MTSRPALHMAVSHGISVIVGGVVAILISTATTPAPCTAGWAIADKTIMPSAAEQILSAASVKDIEGRQAMFRRKVVLTLTCSDGRYRVETRENP